MEAVDNAVAVKRPEYAFLKSISLPYPIKYLEWEM